VIAKTRKLTLLATAVIVLGLVVAGFLPLYLVTPQVVLASPDTLTLRPESAGDSTELTPFPAATANWDCVNEVTSDGDSTYVYTDSNQFRSDLYNVANTAQTGNINSVTVWAKVRGEKATNDVAKTLIKTNGVIYEGAPQDVTTGYSDISTSYYQNPQSTATWTWDEVNLLQAGCSLKRAGPGQQTRCTQVWVAVDYTPPGPPTVDAVALYQSDESTLITPGGSMDPQVEYAVKVTVTDSDTLDDVNEVKVTIFYDSAGTDPTAPGISDTQTCAIITWTKGSGWAIDPSAGTTWVLVSASCKVPSDMGQTTGDWWAHFKPGKVATESGAADDWDIYAKATDAAAGSGELYARDYEMNWYGEITVNTASVDWGTVVLGSDFAANEQTGISVTYIANGAYNQQVKASSPWGTVPNQVTLNEAGNPGAGEFSLKADDTATLAAAVLVLSSGYTTFDTGTQTGESGNTESSNTLWLKLGPSGIPAVTYSGTIYYGIAQ